MSAVFSHLLVVIVCILRHLLTTRKAWLYEVYYDGVSFDCQQEALFPDYVHLSTTPLPPFLSSEEITATAFFNALSWIQCVLCK